MFRVGAAGDGPLVGQLPDGISEIAETFGLFECVECRDAILDALGPDTEANVIEVVSNDPRGFVVFELDDGRDVQIAEIGRHWAIEIDGVVVDNVNPGGLELAEWLRRLGVRPGSTINIEPA